MKVNTFMYFGGYIDGFVCRVIRSIEPGIAKASDLQGPGKPEDATQFVRCWLRTSIAEQEATLASTLHCQDLYCTRQRILLQNLVGAATNRRASSAKGRRHFAMIACLSPS